MKEFLHIISEMIGQLERQEQFEPDTIYKIKVAYQLLSEEEKRNSMEILDELLQENYKVYFMVMSAMLSETKDERLLIYLKRGLINKSYPLWERYSDMLQLKSMLFRNQMLYRDEEQEYKISKEIYRHILEEIQEEMGTLHSYLPYINRRKTIIIIVSQILSINHAPTKKVIDFYRFFKEFGYEVKVFVCFHPGKINSDSVFWYDAHTIRNFALNTTFFEYNTGSEKMEGYNLILHAQGYLQELRETVRKVWEEQPEFIFEIGDQTILAELCNSFTTVVTMGLTKTVPVTNAPIIANFFDYSEEEMKRYISFLSENQRMVHVKHYAKGIQNLNTKDANPSYQKQDFGISQESFVIVIAGNRLDLEITDKFWNILYEILEKDEKFVIFFIGDCQKLQEKVTGQKYTDRIFFSGSVIYFKETIAVGDLFLNPPRQGGGTGAAHAIAADIPVITLDNCDVESSVGKAFVCDSIEEMPLLVYKYFSDLEFMKQQKEFCKKRVEEKMNVDSIGNLKKMLELVEKVAQEEEKTNKS